MTLDRFRNLFQQPKPIIGMIHLAQKNPAASALHDLAIYEEEGLAGVIVENYHSTTEGVESALGAIRKQKTRLLIGVNILPNEFRQAGALARTCGGLFIQLDQVAGAYEGKDPLPVDNYNLFREQYPELVVLGGVWPKYYTPVQGSDLTADIRTGMGRADAIVVTGFGTGQETPLWKLETFREIVRPSYPLLVGAGLTPQNAAEQLAIADGAIVGSAFKPGGNTILPVDRQLVREVMRAIR